MGKLKAWYDQAKVSTFVHKTIHGEFIIVKGFKISLKDGEYSILDVRYSNLYLEVRPEDMEILDSLGFVKGVDKIGFDRDVKRVKLYSNKLKVLVKNRIKFVEGLETNRAFNMKRIRNLDLRYEVIEDLHSFYEARVKQYNKRNN